MKLRPRANLIAALVLLVFSPGAVEACSCLVGKPTCQAYWEYPVVFLGVAAEVKPITQKAKNFEWIQSYKVRFSVVESFRGTDGQQIEIRTGSGGGDCGYPFQQAERYLVYAYRDDKTGEVQTGICTPTRPGSRAIDDLAYIRGLGKKQDGGRIFGTVTRFQCEFDGPCLPFRLGFENEAVLSVQGGGGTPLRDITVRATREGKGWEARTDSGGRYEIAALPPGKYTVTSSLPSNLVNKNEEIEVFESSCAQVDFETQSDGRIHGRLLDSAGEPVNSVPVMVVEARADPTDWRLKNESDFTEPDGTFNVGPLPPGRYFVGVNVGDPPYDARPFPKTFFPGVSQSQQATVIELGDGQKVSSLELRVERLPLVDVETVVVWPDGRPASGAYVYLHNQEYPDSEIVGSAVKPTDESGHITLKAPAGFRYWVHAYARIGYRNEACAEPAQVSAIGSVPQITLSLTHPSDYCTGAESKALRKAKSK